MMKEYLLVSSCLCGKNTKYDGGNNYRPLVEQLKEKYELILVCPEVMGGLSIPRNPSEIKGQSVFMNSGRDVTCNYKMGSLKVLDIVKNYDIRKALLKEKSPSCGVNYIYDGTFSGTKIPGMGITTKMLVDLGIRVYSENEIEQLLKEK